MGACEHGPAVRKCIECHIGATERPESPGKYKRACPVCGAEMSIEPGRQRRMVFHCHLNRGHDQVALHKAMVEIFGAGCVKGNSGQRTKEERQIAAAMDVLKAGKLRGPELRVRLVEVLHDRKMPRDWDEFIEFAALAGLADPYRVARRLGVQARRP